MSGILGLIASPAISSLIGAVGGIFGKISDNKKEITLTKENFKHDREMLGLENARAALELQNVKDVASINASVKQAVAELAAMESSYDNDRATFASVDTEKTSAWFVLVDTIRGLTRPVITGTLTGYFIYLTASAMLQYGDMIDAAEMGKLIFLMVETLANLASLSVSWWFGSRVTVTKN